MKLAPFHTNLTLKHQIRPFEAKVSFAGVLRRNETDIGGTRGHSAVTG